LSLDEVESAAKELGQEINKGDCEKVIWILDCVILLDFQGY